MHQTPLYDVPVEVLEGITDYLPVSDVASLRLSSKHIAGKIVDIVGRRFFSEWHTSLMGDDIRKLKEISAHPTWRSYVKVVRVGDDSERMDPVSTTYEEMDRMSNIWPRHDGSTVQSDLTGVSTLRTALGVGHLTPKSIIIREWNNGNRPARPHVCAKLGEDILTGLGAHITSIMWRVISFPLMELHISLSEPRVSFEPTHERHLINAPLLVNAGLCMSDELGPYWLDFVFCQAPHLSHLRLSTLATWDPKKFSRYIQRGISAPRLTSYGLFTAHIDGQSVYSILANSKDSLTELSFVSSKLTDECTWRSLLTWLACEYQNLRQFELRFLSEFHRRSVIRFSVRRSEIAQRYLEGLELIERGPKDNPRLTSVSYNGHWAQEVLQLLAESIEE